MFALIMLIQLSACKQNKANVNENQSTTATVANEQFETKDTYVSPDDYLLKLQGYWLYFNEYNACEYVAFEDKKFYAGVYPGGSGSAGDVKEIVINNENSINVTIYFPESLNLDDSINPAYTQTIEISSIDSFEKQIIVNDSSRESNFICTYAGKTFDEFSTKCNELKEYDKEFIDDTYSSSNLHDHVAIDYIGKNAQKIFNEFGFNYKVSSLNGRVVFYYENCPYQFMFTDYIGVKNAAIKSLSISPKSNDKIWGVCVDEKGIEVIDGIKIGDKTSEIKQKIDFRENSSQFGATSNLGEYTIRWYIDTIDDVVIMAEVF